MEKEEEPKEILWKTLEFVYHKKSVDWYWYFGLIALILIGTAIALKNILFVFIILISAFLITSYANKQPKEIEYKADKKGISFEDHHYPYRDIEAFCLVDDQKKSYEKILIVQLKKATPIPLIIPLGEVGVDELRTFLLNFIEEQEIPVPFGYTLSNILGF